jgi:hypothetical protein
MASAAMNVMLAQKYDDKIDPTGWFMSEKLDGVRAYWSGSKFYSRQGNQFIAPAWFTKDLPKEPLDGELWCGRGLFQKTLSIIKKTVSTTTEPLLLLRAAAWLSGGSNRNSGRCGGWIVCSVTDVHIAPALRIGYRGMRAYWRLRTAFRPVLMETYLICSCMCS